jgi:hypothetical protein
VDLLHPFQAVLPRGGHDVLHVKAKPLDPVFVPVAVFHDDEGSAVYETAEALGAELQPGDEFVHQGNGADAEKGVGEGAAVGDDGLDAHSAKQEDEDHFERSHLLERTAATTRKTMRPPSRRLSRYGSL